MFVIIETLNTYKKIRLLIPGGSASIEDSGYSRAGSLLYDLAIEANNGGDFFPIWGTCLGFEFLSYVSAGNKNLLTACNSDDRALPLNFKRGTNMRTRQ